MCHPYFNSYLCLTLCCLDVTNQRINRFLESFWRRFWSQKIEIPWLWIWASFLLIFAPGQQRDDFLTGLAGRPDMCEWLLREKRCCRRRRWRWRDKRCAVGKEAPSGHHAVPHQAPSPPGHLRIPRCHTGPNNSSAASSSSCRTTRPSMRTTPMPSRACPPRLPTSWTVHMITASTATSRTPAMAIMPMLTTGARRSTSACPSTTTRAPWTGWTSTALCVEREPSLTSPPSHATTQMYVLSYVIKISPP